MAKVYVTRKVPDAGLALLKKKKHTVTVNPDDRVLTKPELITILERERPDALLSLLTDRIDAGVFAAAPTLKIVANFAVGFDNIDLAAAKKAGVAVANTPSLVVADSVAEHTFALMLALAHRVVESDSFARSGRYKGWDPNLMIGTLLAGKTLGVIGLGRIGRGVAGRAVKGLGMRALYTDMKPSPDFESEFDAKFVKQDALLKESDVVSLHVPLTEKTRHLISTDSLALMKPTAFLVNTARGPIVDEKAVLTALAARQLGGFATDVFECEPSIDCDPYDHLELKAMPNVVMTPHTASATLEAREDMARLAAENIIAALEGKTPSNLAK